MGIGANLPSPLSPYGKAKGKKDKAEVIPVLLGYRVDDRSSRVRFPAGAVNFFLHHRVQNGSGAHPASYPMGARALSLGVKRPGRETDHSPPSTDEVKEGVELYFHAPIRLHGVVLS
jgi:hypothetical protein